MRALVLAPLLAGCFDFSELSECNGTTALVCEGFEHGIDTNVWEAQPMGLTGAIDSVHVHSGHEAFHVSGTPAQAAKYFLQWHQVPNDPTLHVFTRAFLYVPVATENNVVLTTMVEQSGGLQVRTVLTPTSLQLFDGFTSASADSPDAFPVARWTCVEWEVDEGTSASNSGMTLWIDDAQVATLQGPTLTATTDPLSLVSVGSVYFTTPSSMTPFELWFDDVVIDTQRITCRQ